MAGARASPSGNSDLSDGATDGGSSAWIEAEMGVRISRSDRAFAQPTVVGGRLFVGSAGRTVYR